MAITGGAGVDTGAFVSTGKAAPGVEVIDCPAATLDSLFASALTAEDRTLLKLDVEGHQIAALTGAIGILPSVEVLVCEVTFFDVNRTGQTLFADLVDHVRGQGFSLYDVAALAARPRDRRLRTGDVVFVREGSALLEDVSWE